uniref:Uncharacterized protein n=1 Tax=Romanomermis culicivorax TaxID=13658 RepID=A0A915IQH5_ROMCU
MNFDEKYFDFCYYVFLSYSLCIYARTSDFNGENRRTVLKDSNTIPHIFGLTVLDDYLYWTDWTYRGILRASKFNGDNVTVVTQTALLPYGIKAYYEGAQPKGRNPCGENNGDCQQLCLVSPHEGNTTTINKCSCADGFALSSKDNKTCESDCPKETHFLCAGSGSESSACISKKYWCDNVAQCSDKSDEDDCPPRICLSNQFQCHNGRACILDTKLCDGRANCDDGSDEKYCSSS